MAGYRQTRPRRHDDDGLDGTTTRLFARESGYSNGVLPHYFESKDDILLEALRISHDGIDNRIREAVDDKGGFDALRTFHRPACRHRQLTPQGPLQKRQPEMSA